MKTRLILLTGLSILIMIALATVIISSAKRPIGIDDKIQELDDIKQSLTSLSTYIDNQHKQLIKLPSQKLELEQENDKIQKVLSTLGTYVNNQYEQLIKLSSQKLELKQEKDKIQKALQVDKDKLYALLEYQTTQSIWKILLGLFISFIGGVLSTYFVNYVTPLIPLRRKPKKRDEV